MLWPKLASGGVYVIEDLATSFAPDFGGGDPPPAGSAVGLLERLLTDVQTRDPYWQWPDAVGTSPALRYPEVASVLTFPGVSFIEKA